MDAREQAQPERERVDRLDLDARQLVIRFADPRSRREVAHDLAVIGRRPRVRLGRQRRQDGVAAVDRLTAHHLDVVYAEHIVHGGRVALAILFLTAHRLLALGAGRQRSRVCLDVLPARRVLLRQHVGRYPFAVFLNQTAISVLTWQTRIDLEDLDRIVGGAARCVQALLRAALGERIAALTLLVGREMLFDLGGKRGVVGKRPVRSGECRVEQQSQRRQTHKPIIPPRERPWIRFAGRAGFFDPTQ